MTRNMLRSLVAVRLLFLLLLALTGPAATAQTTARPGAATGAFAGNVLDPNDRPVAFADVFLSGTGLGAITDESGAFRIDGVPPGVHTLFVNRIGFVTKTMTVTAAAGSLAVFTITLAPGETGSAKRVRIGSARRTELRGPFSASSVSDFQIAERGAKTTAEALREEPGVFVQKTNHGGGSAILRGLSSNQILLMVDGVRLNNATFRLGNHQYLTTVDPFSLARIEVLRGPNSVAYGSDALGGAVNALTRDPLPRGEGRGADLSAEGGVRYASIDGERTANVRGTIARERWAAGLGVSGRSLGDLKRGTNSSHEALENATNGTEQFPTAFDAWDLDAKVRWLPVPQQLLAFAYQRGEQREVPRYDKYENEGFDRWVFDPQIRELVYGRYLYGRADGKPLFQLTLSRNRQKEGRETRAEPGDPLTIERDEVVTLGANLETYWGTGRTHRVVAGGDLYADDVESRRERRAPGGTTTPDAQGRFPDGASYRSAGLFVLEHFRPHVAWEFDAGLRYSRFDADFTPTDPALATPGGAIEQTFDAVTGSFGMAHVFRAIGGSAGSPHPLRVHANVTQAFRAPNLSDITKLGESKGTTYEVPNYGLDPEKLVSYEFGLSQQSHGNPLRLRWNATFFRSQITDLLASADTTFRGEPVLIENGDTLAVRTKKNVGDAYIQGVEIGFFRQGAFTAIRGNATVTYGQNTTRDEPVGGVPPAFGMLSVGQSRLFGRHLGGYLTLYTRWALEQDRLSADDRDDPRIPAGGTPAWITWNLRYGRRLPFVPGNPRLSATLENLLDVNYREHGSGVNGPGRNLIVSLRWAPV